MSKPFFSIIIPCLNEGRFIPHLLRDLATQTIPLDLTEVLVVDNGSTDDTYEVATQILMSNFKSGKVIPCKVKGVSRAKNTGGFAASGKYLVFLDADTRIGRLFLEDIQRIIINNKSVAGTFRTLPEKNELLSSMIFWTLELIKVFGLRPFGKFFVEKSLFQRAGGFNENIALGENLDLLMRIKSLISKEKIGSFSHYSGPLLCSLRRFESVGYFPVLTQWLIAYFGIFSLQYKTMPQIENESGNSDESILKKP